MKTKPVDTASLVKQGYRRTSRKYGHISRVDRPDWLEHLKEKMLWSYGAYDRAKNNPSIWADQYRRCYSKDVLEINPSAALRIPCSEHDAVGYIEKSVG